MLASHDLGDVARIADSILLLREGRLEAREVQTGGSAAELEAEFLEGEP